MATILSMRGDVSDKNMILGTFHCRQPMLFAAKTKMPAFIPGNSSKPFAFSKASRIRPWTHIGAARFVLPPV